VLVRNVTRSRTPGYSFGMPTNVLVLGAGFGGLELTTKLSEELGADANVTLIDHAEGFVFGFNKFDLVFGWKTLEQVRSNYRDILKPGVTFRQERITSIDPEARRVVTSGGTYEADILVVGLGAEYDIAATPGFAEGGSEFYSIDGALRLRELLPSVTAGRIVIAVLGEPFKCPPAPCEMAMLLDQWFVEHGQRADVEISVVSPWGRPIPPSPEGSKAILDRFAERGITFVKETLVTGIDPATKTAQLRDGGSMPYDLFLGVPRHRSPEVVRNSALAENGWIPVDRGTLATRFPGVYAVGDVTSVGTPKAGVFAENAAKVVADSIIAQVRGGEMPTPYGGTGTCYVEFGDETVARLDADFFGGPHPVAPLTVPSEQPAQEKKEFARDRRRRWFGYAE
jgi:sulfide:quinone oxidoreductase